MKNILVVEDEAIIRLDMVLELESLGYNVFATDTGEKSIEIANREDLDYVIMDVKLKGDMNWIEASREINKLHIPIIFSTANTDAATVAEMNLDSNVAYIKKPFDIEELSNIVKQLDNES